MDVDEFCNLDIKTSEFLLKKHIVKMDLHLIKRQKKEFLQYWLFILLEI